METNDEIPKYRRKKGNKPFAIEYRVVPGHPLSHIDCFGNWAVSRRYEKREDMEKALKELQSRDQTLFEYREKV